MQGTGRRFVYVLRSDSDSSPLCRTFPSSLGLLVGSVLGFDRLASLAALGTNPCLPDPPLDNRKDDRLPFFRRSKGSYVNDRGAMAARIARHHPGARCLRAVG